MYFGHEGNKINGGTGLVVLDIENISRFYSQTVLYWAKNFDKNWEKIKQSNSERFDENFRRKWRLYLYSVAGGWAMKTSNAGQYEITFTKGNVSLDKYPGTRDFLYSKS
jgi:cyclopropane-fatty-acyl-phospholipid synthase